MISLLSMLLSTLSDARDDGLQRARLHELRGRLGLQAPQQQSDLRSRMLWALKQHDMTMRDARFLIRRINEVHDLQDPDHLFVGIHRHRHRTKRMSQRLDEVVDRSVLQHLHKPLQALDAHTVLDVTVAQLPEPGFRSRLEPIVAWLARQIVGDAYEEREEHEITSDRIRSVADWAAAESPDLSRMTWDEAWEATTDWHRQFHRVEDVLVHIEPGVVIARWDDGRTLQRLVSRSQLESEGWYLQHCVGGYWPNVRDGSSIILSYRDELGRPIATIEALHGIHGVSIEQIGGSRNTNITEPEHAHALMSALVESLHFDLRSVMTHLAPQLAIVDEDRVRKAESHIRDILVSLHDEGVEQLGHISEEDLDASGLSDALTAWFTAFETPNLLKLRRPEALGHKALHYEPYWHRIGAVYLPRLHLVVQLGTGRFGLASYSGQNQRGYPRDDDIIARGDSLIDLLDEREAMQIITWNEFEQMAKDAPHLELEPEQALQTDISKLQGA